LVVPSKRSFGTRKMFMLENWNRRRTAPGSGGDEISSHQDGASGTQGKKVELTRSEEPGKKGKEVEHRGERKRKPTRFSPVEGRRQAVEEGGGKKGKSPSKS